MNIWIFNHYANPPDLPGGTRHYDLARELVRRGHGVVIFATSFHHNLHKDTRLQAGEDWRIEEIDGVQFVWIRTPSYHGNNWRRSRNMVAFMIQAWRLGQKLPRIAPDIKMPDVIIGSSPHLLTPLAACRVAQRLKVPFVMEVRDIWPQTIIDMGKLGPSHPIAIALQALEKFLYQQADTIITLLPLAYEHIAAYGFPEDKIVWIPNGVDVSRFDQGKRLQAMENRSIAEDFRVMYLGAHGQANALDVLLQAAKIIQSRNLCHIRFSLIGDGPEKARLMALAQDLGLSNARFYDPVPKSKVSDVILKADAFLFNLEDVAVFKYGISPNKLFDFMVSGKPVITSVHAPENPAEKAGCGIVVPPRDPEALAEAIIKLYEMTPDAREHMGRRGRKYVEDHHDITMLAERLERVLAECVRARNVLVKRES